MPEVVLRDKSGRPILAVDDDGFTLLAFGTQPISTIVAQGRVEGAVAAIAALLTYRVPDSADRTYDVSANIRPTTATTHAITATVAYTDEGGTARTLTLTYGLVVGGALSVTIVANAGGTVPHLGVGQRIRAKRGTTITVATAGTFTAVVYNADASLQLVG